MGILWIGNWIECFLLIMRRINLCQIEIFFIIMEVEKIRFFYVFSNLVDFIYFYLIFEKMNLSFSFEKFNSQKSCWNINLTFFEVHSSCWRNFLSFLCFKFFTFLNLFFFNEFIWISFDGLILNFSTLKFLKLKSNFFLQVRTIQLIQNNWVKKFLKFIINMS